jgi:hypothetical protein
MSYVGCFEQVRVNRLAEPEPKYRWFVHKAWTGMRFFEKLSVLSFKAIKRIHL